MKRSLRINRTYLPILAVMVSFVAISAHGETPKEMQPTAPKGSTAPPSSKPASLSLSEYLGEVSSKHQGYQAADQSAKAAKAESAEGSLIFRPNLTGQATSNTEGISDPLDGGDKFHTRSYKFGILDQTPVGFSGGVYFNRNELNFPPMSYGPAFGSPATAYTANWFSFDFTQSLLRNWNGKEMRAQAELVETSALAKSYSQNYVMKNVLLEAETLYWQLALAREMVLMQKDAVDRAQRIYDYTNKHVRLQLADRAEGLQASTNLQAQKLNLKTAQDSERVAAQAFNSSRGVLSNTVEEKLVELSPELIASFNVPARSVKRDDVRAAEYQAKTTAANATLSLEKNKPTLEFFGSVPLTKPDDPSSSAALVYPVNARPGTTIGLRITAALDIGTQSKVREGYAAEAQAADWTFQRKNFEEERDWQDLTAKFKEAKDRLKLYRDLEKTQGEKLSYERDRQTRGRSTLQQVILFETDFEQAQLGRIQTLAQLLTLNAQMKLYGVSYESR